jgi:hypothetical protein
MTKIDYSKTEDFLVQYPGRQDFFINPSLCKRQKITLEKLGELKTLHMGVQNILSAMEAADSPTVLQILNAEWKRLQFELQRVWGFDQNANFHYWWTVPKCKCPKMDNQDSYGTDYGIVSGACPIHGGF